MILGNLKIVTNFIFKVANDSFHLRNYYTRSPAVLEKMDEYHNKLLEIEPVKKYESRNWNHKGTILPSNNMSKFIVKFISTLLQKLLDFFNEHGANSHLFTVHCNRAALSIGRHFNCHKNMCSSRNGTCCKSVCRCPVWGGCGSNVGNSCSFLYFWTYNFFWSKVSRNV